MYLTVKVCGKIRVISNKDKKDEVGMVSLYVLLTAIEDVDYDRDYNVGDKYFKSKGDAVGYLKERGYEYCEDFREYQKWVDEENETHISVIKRVELNK